MGNAERQAEAEERIRAAVATLEAAGRPVSASAVLALAGGSKGTVVRVLRAVREERAATVPATAGGMDVAPRAAGQRKAPAHLTADVVERVAEAVAEGVPHGVAARLAGVSERAFYYWMRQGEEEEGTLPALLVQRTKDADAAAVRRALQRLASADKGDWQRWAWVLERRWPADFARRDALSVESNSEVRIVVEHVQDWRARDIIDVAEEREPNRRDLLSRGRELDGQRSN